MYMPVLVYSESHAVERHGEALAALGKHALIVTGKTSSRTNGSLQEVIQALRAHDRIVTVFDAVEENPSVATVVRAAEEGRQAHADFVIGVGGGSPLDAAKAIAFLMAQPEDEDGAAWLYQSGSDNHLPLALVPTTCGTGSEVTPVSVLTRTEQQTKKSISHKIFADLALIDGRYLATAPLTVLRNTALDALTHLIESYLNRQADDLSRLIVDSGLTLWQQYRHALENGQPTEEERQGLMNASMMAGIAIAQTSTTIPHGLSYALTIRQHIPHGRAVGYFTAGYLAAAEEADRQYLLTKAGFADLNDFQEWYFRLYGRPNIPEELLRQTADNLWQNQQPKVQTAPFPVDRDSLYRMALYSFGTDSTA